MPLLMASDTSDTLSGDSLSVDSLSVDSSPPCSLLLQEVACARMSMAASELSSSLGAREKEHAEHLLCPRAQRARLAPSQDKCLDVIVWKHASAALVE